MSPPKYMTLSVAISANGTVAVINSEGVSRRMKASSTRADRMPPMTPFWIRFSNASITDSAWLLTVRNVASSSSGSFAACAIAACTSAATATRFASGFL